MIKIQLKIITILTVAFFITGCSDNTESDSDNNDNKITKTYALRDTGPAGGIVFYISDEGRHGLEAAPSSTEWASKQWGKFGTSVGVSAQGTALGTGNTNTSAIVSKLNENPADADRAAQLCDTLNHGGYNDWFLPSKDELNLIYINLYLYGVGEFTGDDYWSSSEYDANDAWDQYFTNGNQFNTPKWNTFRVRAIRAF